jgi:hypothetical protein
MVYLLDENDENERLTLIFTYWSYAIAFQDCQEEGIEINQETIDDFLNWIITNESKLKEYGIFNM